MADDSLKCVYVAPLDRVAETKEELRDIVYEKDNFLIASGPLQNTYWAQNIWENCQVRNIESIKTAATFLRGIQKNWFHFPLSHVRRTKLIQDALPKVKTAPMLFPGTLSALPMGSFALLSENEMIYSPRCSSTQGNGEFHFLEPDYETPSAAYLKLWEALARLGESPRPGDFCVDLGSSPGSWTQALLALGAEVLSIDRAELGIPSSSRLKFERKDAFKVDPATISNPKWIFSDIICYPDKLLDLARAWKRAHPRATFVFTIKFQGKWDPMSTRDFAGMDDSRVCHLFNNKHELCWISRPQ